MEFNIVSIGNKPPKWLVTGIQEYQNRFRYPWQINFINLSSTKKNKNIKASLIEQEGILTLEAIPKGSAIICLDERGTPFTTLELFKQIEKLAMNYNKFAVIIGGADGIAKSCLEKSNLTWSLSNLTLPHQVVKLMVTEQLYRLWSLANNHPYHRN
jgi:23S rRNA (pseudouridine1915-N3)-methyltransferase